METSSDFVRMAARVEVYGPQQCPDWYVYLRKDTLDARQVASLEKAGKEQPFIVLGVKRQLFEHWDKQQHELVN